MMKKNFDYQGFDLYDWLDENELKFEKKGTCLEYTESAYKYLISQQEDKSYPCLEGILYKDPANFKSFFYNIANGKFLLEHEFSKAFIYALMNIHFFQNDDFLVNLKDIHAIYGKPEYFSPHRIINSISAMKSFIEEQVVKYEYRVEEVIQFEPFGIWVNLHIAFAYLGIIDPSKMGKLEKYLDKYDGQDGFMSFLFTQILIDNLYNLNSQKADIYDFDSRFIGE